MEILRVFERSNKTYRDLLTDALCKEDPAWSPDGQLIAFANCSNLRIMLVNVETGEFVETGGFPRQGLKPTWSPDGQSIAYIASYNLRDEGNLVITKLDGSQTIVLAGMQDLSAPEPSPDEFLYTDPMWSPRGDYIAARRIGAMVHDFNSLTHWEVVLIPVPELE